jgi:hypothetical protein
VCPLVEAVLCEGVALAILKDTAVDVTEYASLNMAFKFLAKLKFDEI